MQTWDASTQTSASPGKTPIASSMPGTVITRLAAAVSDVGLVVVHRCGAGRPGVPGALLGLAEGNDALDHILGRCKADLDKSGFVVGTHAVADLEAVGLPGDRRPGRRRAGTGRRTG